MIPRAKLPFNFFKVLKKIKNQFQYSQTQVEVIFNLSNKVENIIVYGVDGKILKRINNTDIINLQEFKNGYYLIQIKDNNRIEKHKLIKN